MKTMRWIAIAACLPLLASCQSPLQGLTEEEIYYSPKAAYGVPLYLSPFRGTVEVAERCNAAGGSATFWDEQGRFFRIDYLQIDEHPMAQAPRFASDQTLLNSVMNNYLREVLPTGKSIEDVDTAVREFVKNREPRSLLVILDMNVDTARMTETREQNLRGTFYYGFLIFKQGEFVYVLQHYQPTLMKDKMSQMLSRLADNLVIPGKTRSATEIERARARWKSTAGAVSFRDKPAATEDEDASKINTARPCE